MPHHALNGRLVRPFMPSPSPLRLQSVHGVPNVDPGRGNLCGKQSIEHCAGGPILITK